MEKNFLSKSNGETLSSHCQKVYETSMNLCLAGGLDNTENGIVKRIVGTTAILTLLELRRQNHLRVFFCPMNTIRCANVCVSFNLHSHLYYLPINR